MAAQHGKIRVALNGYGVIGKRVADAIAAHYSRGPAALGYTVRSVPQVDYR